MDVKIFNLNCWLLPSLLSTDKKKRAAEIISLIKDTNPDIITLQEVWTKKYINLFKEELKKYDFVTSNDPWYERDGLITGVSSERSDLEIISRETNQFPSNNASELTTKVTKKGYHKIELEGNIFIYNTHLYYPSNESKEVITKDQFKLLEERIGDEKAILVGDLDLREEAFMKINNLFKYADKPTEEISRSSLNPYTKSRANKYVEPDTKRDYVLATKKGNIIISSKEIIKAPYVSDHFPIIAHIEIN